MPIIVAGMLFLIAGLLQNALPGIPDWQFGSMVILAAIWLVGSANQDAKIRRFLLTITTLVVVAIFVACIAVLVNPQYFLNN